MLLACMLACFFDHDNVDINVVYMSVHNSTYKDILTTVEGRQRTTR